MAGGMNVQAYAPNPVAWVDPLGLEGWLVTGARLALAGMATDVAVPEPTDAVPWKWVGYGVGAVAAGGIIWIAGDSSKEAVVPQTRTTTTASTRPPRCDDLEKGVRDAKDHMGRAYTKGINPSSCLAGMSRSQLQQRERDWLKLAKARAQRDQVCYGGGDQFHQNEQATAWNKLSECQRLLK